jgi:hypothetical protein
LPLGEAWLALAGALFGGVGLKWIEHTLSKPLEDMLEAKKFRDELRAEMRGVKEELSKTEKDLDVWRHKYYALLEIQNEKEVYARSREDVAA